MSTYYESSFVCYAALTKGDHKWISTDQRWNNQNSTAPNEPRYSHSSHHNHKLLTGKIRSVLKINALLPCFFRCVCWYLYTYPFLFFWKKVLTTNTWNPLNAIMSKLSIIENQIIRDSVDRTVEKLRFSLVRKYFCVRATISLKTGMRGTNGGQLSWEFTERFVEVVGIVCRCGSFNR